MALYSISGEIMADYLRGAKFPLPDDWEPEGYICVRFVIPDDPQYLSIAAGLIDELRYSRNFARDDTGTGAAIVSRTFDKALNQSPVLTEGCEMVDLRINDETCKLEVDCGDDDWKPILVGGATEGYDPKTDDTIEITYEADPDPETGAACVAAAVATEGMRRVLDHLDTAYTLSTVVFWLEVYLTLFLLKVVRKLADTISAMSTAVTTYTQEEYHDAFITFNWDELRDKLHCYYDDRGVMSESSWAALVEDLAPLVGSSPIWAIIYILVQGVGSVGMTNAGSAGGYGITEAECSDCGQWVRYYKTYHSEWPQWVNGQPGTGYETEGEYISGSGWSPSTYQSSGSTYTKMVVLHLNVSGMNLERIIVKAQGTTSTPSNAPLGFVIYDLQHGAYWHSDLAPDDTVFDIEMDEMGSTDNIMIQIGLDQEASFGALSGSGFVYDIELRGTGTAPTGGV